MSKELHEISRLTYKGKVYLAAIGTVLLALLLCMQAAGHSGNPDYRVVIDTDAATDDMRAITMFLSGNNIRVLAVTSSQGTLMPRNGCAKVQSLLSAFYHQGIPVGVTPAKDTALPAWASFARNVQWADEAETQEPTCSKNSVKLLRRTLRNTDEQVTLIALGSLQTYAALLKAHPGLQQQVKRIIWYNSHHIKKGFNYRASPESYEYIRQTSVQLDIVANRNDSLHVDTGYMNSLRQASSKYARQIVRVHEQPAVAQKVKQKRQLLWDDLVPLCLTASMLFEKHTQKGVGYISLNPSVPKQYVHQAIADLLVSATTANNRVFKTFPVDTALYKLRYTRMVDSTITRFGMTEWKAIVLTNEIHGHTGMYSIIGAKMGVRAMEYFNVGVNNMEVTTFAGREPPLSCFNDGLQISTGSTTGQGLLTVSDSLAQVPTATFTYNNRSVKITLRQEISAQLRSQIKQAIRNYGLLTDAYWRRIENLGIRYWTGYTRHKMFRIKTIDLQ